MNYWIIPGNINIFRVTDYFQENDTIDWKQSHYRFIVGDIVFIYVSSPISSVRYMLEVVERDISFEDSIDDKQYWTQKHPMGAEVKNYKYVRLRLLKSSNNPALHIQQLSDFGLKAPQGATRKLSKELIDHLLNIFE